MTSTPVPDLQTSQISDQYIRKNFENLAAYFSAQKQLLDFKFFEQVFTKAQTGIKIAHGLPYIPLDILVTHITGTGAVTFQHGKFDATYIILDASGACRIRFFVGTNSTLQTSTQNVAADTQLVCATPQQA